ncbi:bactofilin family protein [Halorientalis pallida]|nr:polymer-forming cytoskeletal protein [Halorientalis pallida]
MSALRSHSRIALLTVLLVLLGLSVLPGTAAAETRTGGSVVVEANETVDGDLDAFAGSVVISGTVTGDLNGVAGNVRIVGTVDGNVSVASGTVVVLPNATVGGNLDAGAETVTVAGRVDGDVNAGSRLLRLTDTASVGGDVTYGETLERAPGAVVGGTVQRGDVGGGPAAPGPEIPSLVFSVYFLLVNAALGVILLLVFPEFSRAVADRAVDAPLKSGGVGLLALVGTPVALVAIALTVVGLPISFLGIFVFLAVAWTGAIYGRYALGTLVTDRLGVDNRWLALLVGLVAAFALKLLPVVGGVVEPLAVLFGLGALVTVLGSRYRRHRRGAATAEGPTDDGGPGTAGETA